jgi:hypothetical protein
MIQELQKTRLHSMSTSGGLRLHNLNITLIKSLSDTNLGLVAFLAFFHFILIIFFGVQIRVSPPQRLLLAMITISI